MAKTKKKRRILPKHKKFIDFYIESGNASESYIKAGYSKNGADQSAHRLLSNAEIKAEVDRRRAEIAKQSDITIQDIMNEHKKIAFAKMDGVDIKAIDKQKSLDSLGKYLGANNEAEIKKAIAIKKAEHKYSDNNLSDMTAEELIQIINACKQTDN